MDLKDKKVVVIGGAGLIGSHTVDALTRTDVGEIVVFDTFQRGSRENLSQALRDSRVRIFEHGGDITRPDILDAALQGAAGVFHFAALWLLHCQEFPRAAFDVNVAGTFNVLEASIANDVERLVFSSSASVYGDAVAEPMTEDHPYNYENFYGASKLASEAMVRGMSKLRGARCVSLRYMNVYGPRQDYSGAYIAVIMRMLDAIDRDEPLTLYGDGSQAYDFVYVGDCADANLCAMRADTVDRAYNVGTGRRTSIRELAEMLLGITGSDVGIRYLPEGVTFVRNRIGSTDRARDEIGFEAQVGLEEGLRALIDWRQTHQEELRERQERSLTS